MTCFRHVDLLKAKRSIKLACRRVVCKKAECIKMVPSGNHYFMRGLTVL
jgi:hypothetical protein